MEAAARAQPASAGPVYSRREPAKTALYKVMQEHLLTFEQQWTDQASGRTLPKFVTEELHKYMDCGILGRGFAHLFCAGCREHHVVAFSCKARAVCPSCLGRRMNEGALKLTDYVLPDVPLRQFVLTMPFPLRFPLAFDGKLLGQVVRIFTDTVATWYKRRHVDRGLPAGESGAVTVIQRANSDLRLNPHLHTAFLDGVYSPDGDGKGQMFHPAPAPMQQEIEALVCRASKRMKIDSIDKTVKKALESEYYKIPRFQRPYSWDRANVEDFWTDVVMDNESPYFIGSIVLFRDGDGLGVVDGQQRLTTIVMLLCALRNVLHAQGFVDLANGIHQLVERRDMDNKLRFVLHTESSYPYLHEYIMKYGPPQVSLKDTSEEQLLRDAFGYITDQIADQVAKCKADSTLNTEPKRRAAVQRRLVDIRDRVVNLKIISVELDNEDDAYVIFETLNTRGKDLQVSHLVKNHFTKLLKQSNKGVDIPSLNWNELLALLETSQSDIDIDSFLHHYWLSKYSYVTEKQLFKQFRKIVTKACASEVLNALKGDAKLYRAIYEPSYLSWNFEEREVTRSLHALSNVFKVKQPVPLVLALLRDYKAKGISLAALKETLRATEAFHFTFTAIA